MPPLLIAAATLAMIAIFAMLLIRRHCWWRLTLFIIDADIIDDIDTLIIIDAERHYYWCWRHYAITPDYYFAIAIDITPLRHYAIRHAISCHYAAYFAMIYFFHYDYHYAIDAIDATFITPLLIRWLITPLRHCHYLRHYYFDTYWYWCHWLAAIIFLRCHYWPLTLLIFITFFRHWDAIIAIFAFRRHWYYYCHWLRYAIDIIDSCHFSAITLPLYATLSIIRHYRWL